MNERRPLLSSDLKALFGKRAPEQTVLSVLDSCDSAEFTASFTCIYRYQGSNSLCEHVEIDPCSLLRVRIVPVEYLTGSMDPGFILSDENRRYRNLGEAGSALIFRSFGIGLDSLRFAGAKARIYERMLELVLFEVEGGEIVIEREQLEHAGRCELRIESLSGLEY